MGNLPRSRPGRRSEKRSSAGKPSRKGAAKSGRSASRSGAGKRAATSSPRSAGRATQARPSGAAARGAESRATRSRGAQATRGPDPVGDAVRIAAKVAGTGIGIAAGILKRLPRP
jgi:hypothetical protein